MTAWRMAFRAAADGPDMWNDHCHRLGVEAAHIRPYRGEEDNHIENGLLLRADIHTLFDLDLLGINPDGLRLELHPAIAKQYGQFAGKTLGCSRRRGPSREASRSALPRTTYDDLNAIRVRLLLE